MAEKYYQLSVGGSLIRIHYVINDTQWVVPRQDLAVAWLEPTDRRTHYFLFKLLEENYVLRATHQKLNGLLTTLIRPDRELTQENYRHAARWSVNAPRIGGNVSRAFCYLCLHNGAQESPDVHVYRKTIVKAEGTPGGNVTIDLRIVQLTQGQLGAVIENPIVVEDD